MNAFFHSGGTKPTERSWLNIYVLDKSEAKLRCKDRGTICVCWPVRRLAGTWSTGQQLTAAVRRIMDP